MSAKYVVTKADGTPVTDCFVIRRQDTFGAQALFGYAHVLQTAIEVGKVTGVPCFSDDETERLSRSADDIHELALDWQRDDPATKKVPD